MTVKTGIDLTDRMERFSRPRLSALAGEHLSGYVLKKDSPSCGLERVKVYDPHGSPVRGGRGLYAAALVEAYPYLPVEEEGRLADPRLRDNFVKRVFAYWRLRGLFDGRWTVGDLVRFHTAHKLLLLAHAPEAYRRLGRLVAGRAECRGGTWSGTTLMGSCKHSHGWRPRGSIRTCFSIWRATSKIGSTRRRSASSWTRSPTIAAVSYRSSCR